MVGFGPLWRAPSADAAAAKPVIAATTTRTAATNVAAARRDEVGGDMGSPCWNWPGVFDMGVGLSSES
jgi:hypothetical protein